MKNRDYRKAWVYTVLRLVFYALMLLLCAAVLWFIAFMSYKESGSGLYLPILLLIPAAYIGFLALFWEIFVSQLKALRKLRAAYNAIATEKPLDAINDMQYVLKIWPKKLNKVLRGYSWDCLSLLFEATRSNGNEFIQRYKSLAKREDELQDELRPLSFSKRIEDKSKEKELTEELKNVLAERDELVDQLGDICRLR